MVFGEFLHSLNLDKEIDRMFGKPGRRAGYRASSYMLFLLMMQGGGRSLEDLRMIARVVALLGKTLWKRRKKEGPVDLQGGEEVHAPGGAREGTGRNGGTRK